MFGNPSEDWARAQIKSQYGLSDEIEIELSSESNCRGFLRWNFSFTDGGEEFKGNLYPDGAISFPVTLSY